jgi:hypothetical protein
MFSQQKSLADFFFQAERAGNKQRRNKQRRNKQRRKQATQETASQIDGKSLGAIPKHI